VLNLFSGNGFARRARSRDCLWYNSGLYEESFSASFRLFPSEPEREKLPGFFDGQVLLIKKEQSLNSGIIRYIITEKCCW